jgi:type II secretory pathway component GspD/PulD (secretin)
MKRAGMRAARLVHGMRTIAAAALLAVAAAQAFAQQTVLEVIALKYRTVEEMIPVLRPLLPPAATLSGLNNRLIVRTTPAHLAELKQLLAILDTAPRRLIISVRQDADLERSARGGQVSGRIEIGDDVVVRVPGSPAPQERGASVRADGVRARVHSSEGQRTDRISQQVQVMEGGRALIRVGQSVPVRAPQVIDTPDGRRVLRSTELREVETGFYAVPRLSGDQVTLEIYAAADTLQSPSTGATNIQRVETVVSGRLGEWIEIAGIGKQASQRDDGLLARSTDAQREDRRVLLMVEEIR